MQHETTLGILKSALLLEKRGRAFYRLAASQAQDSAVKAFFDMLAQEEERHIALLSEQFAAVSRSGTFSPTSAPPADDHSAAKQVLDAALQARIASADFEAAAISAAMAMEERAIALYSQRAAACSDATERALYRWLSEWETQHLEALAAIDRSLTEQIWNDNDFWPY
jgi:rubrerythrin